jgi:hypothetical protein
MHTVANTGRSLLISADDETFDSPVVAANDGRHSWNAKASQELGA